MCPACPVDSDVEGIATVGGAVLDAFECENGHRLNDLTRSQERTILESAVDWIVDSLDAMRDLQADQRYDMERDG